MFGCIGYDPGCLDHYKQRMCQHTAQDSALFHKRAPHNPQELLLQALLQEKNPEFFVPRNLCLITLMVIGLFEILAVYFHSHWFHSKPFQYSALGLGLACLIPPAITLIHTLGQYCTSYEY